MELNSNIHYTAQSHTRLTEPALKPATDIINKLMNDI